MRFFDRVRDWFAHHPWVLAGFCVGVLAGVIVALPLFSASLPDGVATLLGAAIGAVLAVTGAAWVAGAKDRSQLRVLSAVAAKVTQNVVLLGVDTVCNMRSLSEEDDLSLDDALAMAEGVRLSAQLAAERLRYLEFSFKFNSLVFLQYRELLDNLDHIAAAISVLRQELEAVEAKDADVTVVECESQDGSIRVMGPVQVLIEVLDGRLNAVEEARKGLGSAALPQNVFFNRRVRSH